MTVNKVYLFFLILSLSGITFSQTTLPSSFNVQFSLRRTNGSPNPNKPVLVKATIYNTNGAIYEKIFSETSSLFGIVNVKVEGASSTLQFPTANDFAKNNLSLSIAVDTTNIGGNFFDIYTQQLFAAVPYAIAAKKAPGTFDYQYDDSEAGDVVKGINKDVLFQNDTLDANFFPRLFFNKKNDAWQATENSYSLLPNKVANQYRTIFFDITPSPNLKPRWTINQALTLSNTGLGVNIPLGAQPSKALEVYGAVRLEALSNNLNTTRMVVANQSGDLTTLPIPNGSGTALPIGAQGDILYYNATLSAWVPTSLVQFKNNSLSVARNFEVADTIKGNITVLNSEVFLNNLKNISALDTAIYLSTNSNGRLVSRRMNNFVWSIRGNNLSAFANVPFLGSTDASDLVFKTNNSQTMRMYGQAFGSTRFAGDIDVNNSLYVQKDLSIADNVKFDANRFKNPLPLDSIRFLTTDGNGNLNLHKVKFPTTSAALPNGTNGDLFFYHNGAWSPNSNVNVTAAGSLFAAKNITVSDTIITDILNVKNDVVLSSQFNPQPLDSTRFLTTDGTGKLTLHKVKFPTAGGFLPTGTQGDLFFYNNGAWTPSTNIKMTASGSLFANQNIKATDSLLAANVKVKNDVILSNQLNAQFLDSSQFLTTDPTGKVVLQKVKIPVTIPVSSTVKTKYMRITAANQTYNASDTTRLYVNHIAVTSGTYKIVLPLAVSNPNRNYEIYFSRGGPGQTADFQLTSTVGFFDIFNFNTGTATNSYTNTTNNDFKVTLTSTYISLLLGYEWVLTVENLD